MTARGLIGAIMAAAILAGCGGGPAASPSLNGKIVFSQPSYSCALATTVTWTAHLSDKAGGLNVTIVYARKLAGGTEASVVQGNMPVTNPDFNLFTNDLAASTFCADPFGPGDYAMRIVRASDSKVLAEGTFTIAP